MRWAPRRIDVKHVLGRALAVNFTDSLRDLQDLTSWLGSQISSQSPPTA